MFSISNVCPIFIHKCRTPRSVVCRVGDRPGAAVMGDAIPVEGEDAGLVKNGPTENREFHGLDELLQEMKVYFQFASPIS